MDIAETLCPPVRLSAMEFFNYMNNMTPLLLGDLRTAHDFAQHRIKDSLPMDAETCVEKVNAELRLGFAQRKYKLIFVISSSTSSEARGVLSSLLPSSFDPAESIISISILDYDEVFAAYQNVPGIISTSNEPINITYPSEILPRFLYLGGYIDDKDVALLDHLGITHIVDATGAQMSKNICGDRISYLPINIWDVESADISQHFEVTNQFISTASKQEGRVLVHCRAGVSRSTSLVLAYLLHSRHFGTLAEALSHVAKCRPWIIPNAAFRKQLRDYEAQLRNIPSIATDEEFIGTIEKYAVHWINTATYETDLDRRPIVAGRGLTPAFNVSPYPIENEMNVPPKPKKPFLRKGQKRTKS